MAKLSKAESGYRYHHTGYGHCRECAHFDAPDQCKIIWGIITGKGHCDRFAEPSDGEIPEVAS